MKTQKQKDKRWKPAFSQAGLEKRFLRIKEYKGEPDNRTMERILERFEATTMRPLKEEMKGK